MRKYINKGETPDFLRFIKGHECYSVPANYEPSDFEHQIILASIVGDGSISRPYTNRECNARIQWNMGNKEHALFKAEKFSFVGTTFRQKENPGFGNDWFCLSTKSHPIFSKYASKYGERKKNISPESGIYHELNAIGWAWLYGDDGHVDNDRGIAYLHTEGLSKAGVEVVCDAMNKFIGGGATTHRYIGGIKKRELHCLRLTKDATNEFFSRIKAHMARGVEYKVF